MRNYYTYSYTLITPWDSGDRRDRKLRCSHTKVLGVPSKLSPGEDDSLGWDKEARHKEANTCC